MHIIYRPNRDERCLAEEAVSKLDHNRRNKRTMKKIIEALGGKLRMCTWNTRIATGEYADSWCFIFPDQSTCIYP